MEAVDQLHQLWQAFASDLNQASENFGSAVKSLDLHGCRLKVLQSRNPMLVGLEGVVISLSSACFHLAITTEPFRALAAMPEANPIRLYHVPKAGSVFSFVLPGPKSKLVILEGNNLQ